MPIDQELISSSSTKGSRTGGFFPKQTIYSIAGFGTLFIVGFIKTFFPFIGMAFLLALIWSQSTTNRKY